MLLTLDDMLFLGQNTEPAENGMLKAKQNLNKTDKERLVLIDNINFVAHEKHLIVNYKEL